MNSSEKLDTNKQFTFTIQASEEFVQMCLDYIVNKALLPHINNYMAQHTDPLMSTTHVCEYLDCSKPVALEVMKDLGNKCIKLSKEYKCYKSDLDAYLKNNKPTVSVLKGSKRNKKV